MLAQVGFSYDRPPLPEDKRERELAQKRASGQRSRDRAKALGIKRCYPAGYSSDWWLKKRYGLTRQQVDAMAEKQNNRCATCGGPPVRNRRLCIDHDHDTGAVRGLLCVKCNTALGHVGDDPNVLQLMIDYLKDHSESRGIR